MLWHGKNFRGIINKAKEMIFNNTGTNLISTNAEDAIKEVNSNLPLIECGTQANVTLAGNESRLFEITFTKTFTAIPKVTATLRSSSGNNQIFIRTVTTTEVEIYLYNADTGSSNVGFDWIAVKA